MNLNESLRIAIDSLLINRMRAVLTTLGIIIGVAAVVSLVNLGAGVEDYVNRQFSNLGVDVITVTPKEPDSDTTDRIEPLTVQEARDLETGQFAPHVAQVVMQYNVQATLRYGGESRRLVLNGVTPNYVDVNEWTVESGGTFITSQHLEDRARVMVLGDSIVEDLFGNASFNPIGLQIDVNGSLFTVVGIMETQSGQGFADPNAVGFVPLSTAQTRLDDARVRGGTFELSQMQIQATSATDVDDAIDEITEYLRTAHQIPFVGEEDFQVTNAGDTLDTLSQITSILTIFLGLIAGISLLVGGIGIMNIMLVSVSERTKEIGLRKAVGAQRYDILGQFLIESVILSILGGIIGILIGWAVILIAELTIPDFTISLSLGSIVLATGVSTFVGVFFGFYPANRASRLAPIDALRSD